MGKDEGVQSETGPGPAADEQHQSKSRGQIREDHLTAGRQLASDETKARANTANARPDASPQAGENQGFARPAVDNDDISELSENDSSGG